jgi:hypothetical protein
MLLTAPGERDRPDRDAAEVHGVLLQLRERPARAVGVRERQPGAPPR